MPSVPPPRAKASHNRPQTGLTPVFLPVFATATLPTRGPVPSPRAKASPNRPQTGLTPAFLPVLATATLPTMPSVPTPRVKPVIYRPFGTGTLNRRCSEAWWRAETVIYRHFGTGTPPTRGSVPSSRAKASPNRPQTGLSPVFLPVLGTATLSTSTPEASWRGEGGFWPVFVTSTLPTDASVPSSRSHCELVHRIVAEMGFVKFTWHEPSLIIK